MTDIALGPGTLYIESPDGTAYEVPVGPSVVTIWADTMAGAFRSPSDSMNVLTQRTVAFTTTLTEAGRLWAREAMDEAWRRDWYRDPGSAWWER